MVIQYKCPQCGADLLFDSDSGKLHCDSCGYEEVIDGATGKFSDFKEEFHSATFGDEKVKQYQCKNCGAVLITDENTTATTCNFCGAPMILGDRLSGDLAPTKVIPFRISKKEAEASFQKWCKKAWFSPNEFRDACRIKSVTGIYVPFWLYDLAAQGEALAHCTRSNSHSEGDYIVTKTHHFDAFRKVDLTYREVPADASKKMADDLMDRLEPFNYRDLKEFNTPYLAGYLAEKYDYTDREMFSRVENRAKDFMEQYIRHSIYGFETVNIVERNYHVGQLSADYALLPIWMVYYDYENAEYSFAMNGQTGKISGAPPLSVPKIVGSICGLTAIAFLICRIITVLLGGPII